MVLLLFLAISHASPVHPLDRQHGSGKELTKVWLRTTGINGRWIIEGEGPAWHRFRGGVDGELK